MAVKCVFIFYTRNNCSFILSLIVLGNGEEDPKYGTLYIIYFYRKVIFLYVSFSLVIRF